MSEFALRAAAELMLEELRRAPNRPRSGAFAEAEEALREALAGRPMVTQTLARLARAAHVLAVPEGSLISVPDDLLPEDDDERDELLGVWGKAVAEASGHMRFVIVTGDVAVLEPAEAREALQTLGGPPMDRATVERVVAGVIDWTEAVDIGTKRAAAELTAEIMAAFTTAGLVNGDG